MKRYAAIHSASRVTLLLLVLTFPARGAAATNKLIGFYSARTMSQAMPWIAEETGLFRKYDLEFQLVYISSAPMVTAALLGGGAGFPLRSLRAGPAHSVRRRDPRDAAIDS